MFSTNVLNLRTIGLIFAFSYRLTSLPRSSKLILKYFRLSFKLIASSGQGSSSSTYCKSLNSTVLAAAASEATVTSPDNIMERAILDVYQAKGFLPFILLKISILHESPSFWGSI